MADKHREQKLIVALALSEGHSQTDAARMAGVHRNTVAVWIRGWRKRSMPIPDLGVQKGPPRETSEGGEVYFGRVTARGRP